MGASLRRPTRQCAYLSSAVLGSILTPLPCVLSDDNLVRFAIVDIERQVVVAQPAATAVPSMCLYMGYWTFHGRWIIYQSYGVSFFMQLTIEGTILSHPCRAGVCHWALCSDAFACLENGSSGTQLARINLSHLDDTLLQPPAPQDRQISVVELEVPGASVLGMKMDENILAIHIEQQILIYDRRKFRRGDAFVSASPMGSIELPPFSVGFSIVDMSLFFVWTMSELTAIEFAPADSD